MFKLVRRLQGVFPAIPTPLTVSGGVDAPNLERIASKLIDSGVNGIVGLGTAGEGPVLSAENRKAALKVLSGVCGGRVPLIVGCGAVSQESAITMVSHAADHGADAVLLLPPLYFSYPELALEQYFTAVADVSPVPVLIYHYPDMSKNPLSVPAVARLARHPNIAGIKDSHRDFSYHLGLLQSCQSETFKVFQGAAPLIWSSYTAGSDGAISPVSALAPEWEVNLYHLVKEGRAQEAKEYGQRITGIGRLMQFRGMPQPTNFKAMASLLGFGGPYPHAPAPTADAQHLADLRVELERNGLAVVP